MIVGKQKQIVQRQKPMARPSRAPRLLTLPEFYKKRNQILVVRSVGGLGDIFMHRMMFEDFKRIIGEGELHFACPVVYHQAVIDHPYVDRILDSATVDKLDYIACYNTTTACGRYELKMGTECKLHRSDIWSQHCGVQLEHHNMHIMLTEQEKQEGRDILETHRTCPGPTVVISPISAMVTKNLLPEHTKVVLEEVRKRSCCPYGLHYFPIPEFSQEHVPTLHSLNIRQWMSVLAVADYVISVDTAAFHCAGGLKRPLLGIYTFANIKVYAKYYDYVGVQKHRDDDPTWCGPCYDWGLCMKDRANINTQTARPCLSEITGDMLREGIDKLFTKWPGG